MRKRKLILIIVEGSTDERALSGVLGKTLDANSIKFKIVKGNLFTDEQILIKDAKTALDTVVDDFFTKNPQYQDEVEAYVQITDTDGCFLTPSYIVQGGDEITYQEDRIVTPNRSKIIQRNNMASQKLDKLARLGIYRDKPYWLLYMSREQEHVLHDEIRKLSVEEKEEYAKCFRKKYRGHESDFKEFITNSPFAVPGTYEETWAFIRKENYSLHRYSNLHLIYDIVEVLNQDSMK